MLKNLTHEVNQIFIPNQENFVISIYGLEKFGSEFGEEKEDRFFHHNRQFVAPQAVPALGILEHNH
jgi:hypothetical protein